LACTSVYLAVIDYLQVFQTSKEFIMDTSRRLTRSSSDRVIAGVAGGIAAYLGVDSVLIRLALVALFFTGAGFFLYPILWVIMPAEGAQAAVPSEAFQEMRVEFERVGERMRNAVHGVSSRHVSQQAGETDIPVHNLNPGTAAVPTERNRQVGILLIGIGVLVVGSMIFGAGFVKILFPIALVSAGLIILGRNAQAS
jgi:phage shock protein C